MSDDSLEGIDAILEVLAEDDLERSGWRKHVNHETGAIAMFPSVPHHIPGSKAARAAENEWEARCQSMHDQQITLVPEPKPEVNTLQERVDQLRRGD